MKYPRLLLRLLLLSLPAVLVLAAADVPAAHRPGCPSTCGNVDIPYPFGIGDQCAINPFFGINCTVVNGTEKPYKGPFEVTKISVHEAKAWMKMGISWQCGLDARQSVWSQYFTLTPFSFSYVDNKIVVVGCNTLAYMKSEPHIVGCYATCSDSIPKNGSCIATAGCCEAGVPEDLGYFEAYFNKNYNTSYGCGYIVVIEEKAFSYSTTYADQTKTEFWDAYKGQVPVVMDWVITRDDACNVATTKNQSSYACLSNDSHCVNSTNGRGTRCKCDDDIDECRTDPCAAVGSVCQNTRGHYNCSCPPEKQEINGICVAIPLSPPPPTAASAPWVKPVLGASVGSLVLVITITCVYLIQERRKLQHIKQRYFQQHGGMLLFEEIKSQQGIAFKIFSEAELQEATDKFNERGVLGHGGHGTVYKGLLAGNVEVAVKRCMSIDEQHKKEFGKEMLILSQINHKNIVKLFGCCLEVEVPMLVYEFIPNGTFFQPIHGNHGRQISLATRMQIAHQSAEALAYLHSWASPPILHGDVKSSNILIDRDYTAKVSDFGASILAPTDESQFVTLVQGTCGYLDPEYMQTCQLTEKSDVYSFGVVLLELLTRKKPFNLDGPEHEKSLVLRFISMTKEDKLEEILDDQIMNDENMEVLEEVAELAKQCLEISGVNRPSMREVSEET
ncbi:putative wall-associated receptor kinase-like 16 isoform X1 [Panicum miliaceum]|uniref:Wall-associated receptor kinase-like 16 isoform X1 n=1 Tax=Panicum miliaceum TaxID=4540 RepID=A0A3L6QQ44_PANMI|nr:putative wall-associated receptor kinase-like 16 isoform X1 [Panicum miliaceum]